MQELFDDLRAALGPEIAAITTERSMEIMQEVGVGFDIAAVSEEAMAWAESYNYRLVTGLTDTTRKLVSRSVSTYTSTPGMTRGDLERLLAPAFGEARASAIAVTEVTRAYSEATNEQQRWLEGEGVSMRRIWETLRDDLVCFPAQTMVETESGPRAIELISTGDLVWTRKGLRPVIATSKRWYTGLMVVLEHEQGFLTSTANHPIWESEQGWLEARDFAPGSNLQTFGNQASRVNSVLEFGISDAHNLPATAFEKEGLEVYNLQVADDPTFFADGVLVHNCPICGPLNGLPEDDWKVAFPTGPPAHPNCRCSTSLSGHDAAHHRADAEARATAREKLMREKAREEGRL